MQRDMRRYMLKYATLYAQRYPTLYAKISDVVCSNIRRYMLKYNIERQLLLMRRYMYIILRRLIRDVEQTTSTTSLHFASVFWPPSNCITSQETRRFI